MSMIIVLTIVCLVCYLVYKHRKGSDNAAPKPKTAPRFLLGKTSVKTDPSTGALQAFDANGTQVDVSRWSAKKQEAAMTEIFFTEGPEQAAKAIKLLPSVVNGKTLPTAVVSRQFSTILDRMLADNYFSHDEEDRLNKLFELLNIEQAMLQPEDVRKLLKAKLVRDLIEGNVKPVMVSQGGIILQKNEILIWAEQGMEFSTLKTVKNYVAGSGGLSFKVAKGVYYHSGSTRGHSESHKQRASVGRGLFAVSTKGLTIQARELNKRIPYEKLINVIPYRDGLEINCENNYNKPIWVKTNEADFWANIIVNAHNWQ